MILAQVLDNPNTLLAVLTNVAPLEEVYSHLILSKTKDVY